MNIYRFTFPIDDYYAENVFEKYVYFVGENCPTHEQIHQRIQELAEDEEKMSKDPTFGPSCREYNQCLEAISLATEKLPHLAGNLVGSNIHINHPRWGRQSISVAKIVLHDINKPFVSYFDGGNEY